MIYWPYHKYHKLFPLHFVHFVGIQTRRYTHTYTHVWMLYASKWHIRTNDDGSGSTSDMFMRGRSQITKYRQNTFHNEIALTNISVIFYCWTNVWRRKWTGHTKSDVWKKNTFKSHREAYKATTLVLYTHRSVFSFVRPSSGLGRDNAEIMSPMLKINKYIYGVWQRISQKLAMMMARIRKSIISYVAECRNTPYYVPRLKNTTIHLMKMDDIDPPIWCPSSQISRPILKWKKKYFINRGFVNELLNYNKWTDFY